MKNILLIVLAGLATLTLGCGNQSGGKDDEGKSPAFMLGCYRKEIVSSNYHVPKMNTPAQAAYIQRYLKQIPGYVDSSCDLAKHTVTVSYQSTTVRSMNFEEAIAISGFAVNDRPANPNAKIPEEVK